MSRRSQHRQGRERERDSPLSKSENASLNSEICSSVCTVAMRQRGLREMSATATPACPCVCAQLRHRLARYLELARRCARALVRRFDRAVHSSRSSHIQVDRPCRAGGCRRRADTQSVDKFPLQGCAVNTIFCSVPVRVVATLVVRVSHVAFALAEGGSERARDVSTPSCATIVVGTSTGRHSCASCCASSCSADDCAAHRQRTSVRIRVGLYNRTRSDSAKQSCFSETR